MKITDRGRSLFAFQHRFLMVEKLFVCFRRRDQNLVMIRNCWFSLFLAIELINLVLDFVLQLYVRFHVDELIQFVFYVLQRLINY
jgi:hypothetical protein